MTRDLILVLGFIITLQRHSETLSIWFQPNLHEEETTLIHVTWLESGRFLVLSPGIGLQIQGWQETRRLIETLVGSVASGLAGDRSQDTGCSVWR